MKVTQIPQNRLNNAPDGTAQSDMATGSPVEGKSREERSLDGYPNLYDDEAIAPKVAQLPVHRKRLLWNVRKQIGSRNEGVHIQQIDLIPHSIDCSTRIYPVYIDRHEQGPNISDTVGV